MIREAAYYGSAVVSALAVAWSYAFAFAAGRAAEERATNRIRPFMGKPRYYIAASAGLAILSVAAAALAYWL